ncbi:HAD family hydrolase [Methylocapsa sp. S129]|uniref:HAD family hydrolase n=1 Tax=Methylocapsa sp. S129 TaxID=1641869 RepID=UPI00131D3CFF|nr:HAD family hydrolase [Methylocapsa sp. S129]
MQWPELVIFDCDGVLVDSELIALGQTRQALGEAGLPLTHAQAIDRFLGFSLDSIVQKAEADLAGALPADFRNDLSRDILARFASELKGIEGVRQAVEGLHCRVCVASSSPPERIRLALSVAGYGGLFEPHIFSATMAPRGKPHPDLFLHAAHEMGASPDRCLVIEDSAPGVLAAVSAGMDVFGFVGGSHFSPGAAQGERLKGAGALLIFSDMSQLPEIIAQRLREDQANSASLR